MLPPTQPSLLEEMKQSGTRQEAFDRFCRLYRPGLVARCRGWGLQPSDAEDITQVLLLRLWDSLRDFAYDPDRGSFRGYLTRVVGNAVTDHFRDRQRHPQPEAVGGTTAHELSQRQADPAGGQPPSSPGAGVDGLASAIEGTVGPAEWEAIARVRARVDARTWECFVLREVERLPVEDVMKATGKREGAIYQVIYRIRRQIGEEHQRVLREREPVPEAEQP
jgi:RNA polymerase sigma factor (sigma-70 family)